MPRSCRIATFNLENFGALARDTDFFERRLTRLRDKLQRLDADILCLQEVNAGRAEAALPRDFSALDALLSGTPYAAFERVSSVRPGSRQPADVHNLVILSRWGVATSRQVFHEFVAPLKWSPPPVAGIEQAGPIMVRWERPILHARIGFSAGRSLDVVNLHLRAPRAAFFPGAKAASGWVSSASWAEGLFLAALKRDGQALEARLFVETLFEGRPEASIFVCGDFNAEDRDMAMRIIEVGRDDVEESAIAGRELVAIEARLPASERYSVIHRGRRLLPDHILVSQELAGHCAEVVIDNAGLDDEAVPVEPIIGSLHAPLAAEFLLPDA
ncbi:MAG: endonuclease/exonuclease/phosphatase family protein [Hyphomicrobiales bacterium]